MKIRSDCEVAGLERFHCQIDNNSGLIIELPLWVQFQPCKYGYHTPSHRCGAVIENYVH